MYGEVLVRRWNNTLGRTMWDFTASTPGHRRFLVIGHGKPAMTATRNGVNAEHRRFLVTGGYHERLIVFGSLLSDDGSDWLGTASMVELPDRASAEAMVAHSPYSRAGLYSAIEVHARRFGGRPKQ